MFGVDITTHLPHLVEEFLPREKRFTVEWDENGSTTHEGIVFEINLRVRDWRKDNLDEMCRRFMVLFFSNVSVFYAPLDDYIYPSDIPVDNWINTSNHDSCWRSDGLQFISKNYFEMCAAVNKNVAPIMLESTAGIGFLSLYRKVRVVSRSSRNNDYRREIVSMEEIA